MRNEPGLGRSSGALVAAMQATDLGDATVAPASAAGRSGEVGWCCSRPDVDE